jgi:DNA-binding transcriptional regulator LsrR (DeoR family)
MNITDLIFKTTASLHIERATETEMAKRLGISSYSAALLLQAAKKKGYIYERNGKYYAYKSVIPILKKNDWLD